MTGTPRYLPYELSTGSYSKSVSASLFRGSPSSSAEGQQPNKATKNNMAQQKSGKDNHSLGGKMCPYTCTAPKRLVRVATAKLLRPQLTTFYRRRRKHGTHHGRPRRCFTLGDSLPNSRGATNSRPNPHRNPYHGTSSANRRHRHDHRPPRPRLLLSTRHRPPQALARRRPALVIQVLLRQARPQASDFAPLLSHQHASLACQRLPVHRSPARVSVLGCGMQAVFLFFCC